MANDLTNLTFLIGPVIQEALRGMGPLYAAANTDFSLIAAQRGQTIDAVFPVSLTAKNVNPNASGSQAQSVTPTKVQLTLDTWREVDFFLTHKETAEISNGPAFIQGQIRQAVEDLMGDFQLKVFQVASSGSTEITTYASTTGSLNQLTSSFGPLLTVRKALSDAKAPQMQRSMFFGTGEINNLLQNPNLTRMNEAGTGETLRQGQIGRLFGFDIYESNYTPSNVSGSVNIGLQRTGLGIAVRPANSGPNVTVFTDPISGMPITLTITPQEYQTKWSLSYLAGVKVLNADLVQTLYSYGS